MLRLLYRYVCASQRTRALPSAPATIGQGPAFVSHIEVEKKFSPTWQLRKQLGLLGKANETDQCFRSIEYPIAPAPSLSFTRLSNKIIQDSYYDLNRQLSSQGIWVRRRTCYESVLNHASSFPTGHSKTTLEAKVRLGGDYTDSKFQEIEGESDIRSYLVQHLPTVNMEHLMLSAHLETHRKSWAVHERKKSGVGDLGAHRSGSEGLFVVLDKVEAPLDLASASGPFKHEVGEVELTKEVRGGADQREHEELKQQATLQMDSVIEQFVARHSNLFSRSPKPKGKLNAYFEWKERIARR